MEIRADIIDYMGRLDDGVLVLLSIDCGGEFSEATIFYSNQDLVLTVSPSVEEAIGGPVEMWEGYMALMESILKRLVPRDEIYNRLDEVDFSRYVAEPEDGLLVDGEVDPSEIAGTQSA